MEVRWGSRTVVVERRVRTAVFGPVADGRAAGVVTSGTFAPFLKKSIGLAYLPAEAAEVGACFDVEIRGRAQPATVVPTPFYKRD